jgi:hypothetical protein
MLSTALPTDLPSLKMALQRMIDGWHDDTKPLECLRDVCSFYGPGAKIKRTKGEKEEIGLVQSDYSIVVNHHQHKTFGSILSGRGGEIFVCVNPKDEKDSKQIHSLVEQYKQEYIQRVCEIIKGIYGASSVQVVHVISELLFLFFFCPFSQPNK